MRCLTTSKQEAKDQPIEYIEEKYVLPIQCNHNQAHTTCPWKKEHRAAPNYPSLVYGYEGCATPSHTPPPMQTNAASTPTPLHLFPNRGPPSLPPNSPFPAPNIRGEETSTSTACLQSTCRTKTKYLTHVLEGEKNHKKGGLNCVFGNIFFYVLDNCPQVQSLKKFRV